jgi:hypothetical protein
MSLNLNPEGSSPKKNKKYKKALAVGGAVSLAGLGSTFAANISLNQGNNVEFGQGVAQTAACDEDGFSITPVTSYDNSNSIFRVDRVQVSGLNLTPVGTGWNNGDLNGAYGDQSAAKIAHPGQYYDGSAHAWKRTCDGVVLDFSAYTDDPTYAGYTKEGYANNSTTSVSTPLLWSQWQGQAPTRNWDWRSHRNANAGFAVVFDINDQNNSYDSNYGAGDVNGDTGRADIIDWENLDSSSPENSSFDFYTWNAYRPNAAAISKITVSSMAHFPSNYYLSNVSGIGVA